MPAQPAPPGASPRPAGLVVVAVMAGAVGGGITGVSLVRLLGAAR